jgi:hypothetical protein
MTILLSIILSVRVICYFNFWPQITHYNRIVTLWRHLLEEYTYNDFLTNFKSQIWHLLKVIYSRANLSLGWFCPLTFVTIWHKQYSSVQGVVCYTIDYGAAMGFNSGRRKKIKAGGKTQYPTRFCNCNLLDKRHNTSTEQGYEL